MNTHKLSAQVNIIKIDSLSLLSRLSLGFCFPTKSSANVKIDQEYSTIALPLSILTTDGMCRIDSMGTGRLVERILSAKTTKPVIIIKLTSNNKIKLDQSGSIEIAATRRTLQGTHELTDRDLRGSDDW